MEKTIAVLYICTGNYVIFWDNFHKSFSKHFLPGYKKHYFVFTDQEDLIVKTEENISIIYQKKLGWPYDTLFRFHMFYSIDEQLKKFDYIFFFNANMICLEDINDSILPNNKEQFVVVTHPGFFNKDRSLFTYESNPLSTAYIPEEKGSHYFMGGFNGGIGKFYRALIKNLKENIDFDLKKNKLIAIWHDESHLNKYMLERTPKVLSPAYGYPEGVELPFDKKIIILDKNRFGGHNAMRGIKKSKPLNEKIKKILHFFKLIKNG
jgi:hypothetical protein